jgi:hypothetical protein
LRDGSESALPREEVERNRHSTRPE